MSDITKILKETGWYKMTKSKLKSISIIFVTSIENLDKGENITIDVKLKMRNTLGWASMITWMRK